VIGTNDRREPALTLLGGGPAGDGVERDRVDEPIVSGALP